MTQAWLDRLGGWWRTRQALRQIDSSVPLPDLRTPRLRLRPFYPGDAEGIFGYASDPGTARYMVWKRHTKLEDSQAALQYFLGGYVRGDDMPVAIVRRSDGRLLGCSGFQYPLRSSPWMAWILRSDAWGQGYGSEAVRALLGWGWRAFPRWRQVEAPIHPKNAASIALARMLGFRQVPCGMKFRMSNLNGRLQAATNWVLERPR